MHHKIFWISKLSSSMKMRLLRKLRFFTVLFVWKIPIPIWLPLECNQPRPIEKYVYAVEKEKQGFPPSWIWIRRSWSISLQRVTIYGQNKQWVASDCYCSQWSPSSWYNVLKRRILIVSPVRWKLLKSFQIESGS